VSEQSLEDRVAPVTASIWSDDDRSRADLDHFLRVRPRLFAIAHRIVGNVHEAEDVVQEVWLRWHRVDRTTVINAEAFLVTMTIRLAINLVQSARRRHEAYVAPCLGEEAAGADADPLAETERGEAIDLAVQLLLEYLPPPERAAFMLREGFGYPYQQIAKTLQIGTANARQLAKRARARMAAGQRRPFSSAARGRLLRAFAAASRTGDLTGLELLLAADLKRGG
jgi:RNA polymerase sigma factor (sigma-70 family)